MCTLLDIQIGQKSITIILSDSNRLASLIDRLRMRVPAFFATHWTRAFCLVSLWVLHYTVGALKRQLPKIEKRNNFLQSAFCFVLSSWVPVGALKKQQPKIENHFLPYSFSRKQTQRASFLFRRRWWWGALCAPIALCSFYSPFF